MKLLMENWNRYLNEQSDNIQTPPSDSDVITSDDIETTNIAMPPVEFGF